MKTKKILFIIIIFMFVLMIFEIPSFAGEKLDTSGYETSVQKSDASYIFSKGGELLKVLRNIAAIVAVVTITILGIRYILGSVDQRAEYKQTMLPVIIGCFLVAGLSGILTLIQSIF